MRFYHSLPQNDQDSFRAKRLLDWRARYRFGHFREIPINADSSQLDLVHDTVWEASVFRTLLRIRSNLDTVIQENGWKFTKPIPQFLTKDFVQALLGRDLARVSGYLLPDLGQMVPDSRPQSLADYRKVFARRPLPEIAERFLDDRSFAYTFVAGSNPVVLQRMCEPLAHFPIGDEHLQVLPACRQDSLARALAEGRIYYLDFASLGILENGQHYGQTTYVFQPLCAFVVPPAGGLMQPFAIQTGQDPVGRNIYTPQDGWSWRIAKTMVQIASGNHHEAVTHLGHTHLILEPMVVSTYRQLSHRHPIYALLFHHFVGTLQINNLAVNWLLQPGKPFDVLTGATLESVYALTERERLEFDFRAHYLPERLARQGVDDSKKLPVYPYRDDALLLWEAIEVWVREFLECFYSTDGDVQNDVELQAWAREIADPAGGRVKNFIQSEAGIESLEDLSGVLTMIIFTAGPQHAAVNFPQQSDMSYTPAAPLAGFREEIQGKGHSEQDFLDMLPPLEIACTAEMVLNFLGEVHFDRLGHYALTFAPDGGRVNAAIQRLQERLRTIEAIILERNAHQRPYPYPHLYPSRIPKSVNV